MALQQIYFLPYLIPYIVYCHLRSIQVETSDVNNLVEVGYCEIFVYAAPVVPYRPYEERKYGFAVQAHELFKIENGMIVECNHYACVVQRRRITLVVLYGVCVCVQHVGTVEYLA